MSEPDPLEITPLPDEVWERVAAFLAVADQVQLSGVNRRLYQQFSGIRPARSQAELEAALADLTARLIVLLPGAGVLIIRQAPANPEATLVAETGVNIIRGMVYVRAPVRISATGTAQVSALGSAQVTASGAAEVVVFDQVQVTATDTARVIASSAARVIASGAARVTAFDQVQVTATDTAWVLASGSAQVTARDTARVVASSTGLVVGQGPGVQILARDWAQVDAEPGTVRVLPAMKVVRSPEEFDQLWEQLGAQEATQPEQDRGAQDYSAESDSDTDEYSSEEH